MKSARSTNKINGTDPISLEIFEQFRKGATPKILLADYPISLDQGKKLSRVFNYQVAAQKCLKPELFKRLQELGLKIIVLADFFKEQDWDGLSETLQSVDTDIKRDELALYPSLLKEKRKRITNGINQINYKIAYFEQQEAMLVNTITRLENEMNTIQGKLGLIKDYDKKIVEFLLDHIGMVCDNLCLRKRLDYKCQKALIKKNILKYDEMDYVYYVEDIVKLAEQTEYRLKRNFAIKYNSDEVSKYSLYGAQPVEYRNKSIDKADSASLLSRIKDLDQEILALNKEKRECSLEIKKIRHSTPESFMESVLASNELSKSDQLTHGKLQDFALKWLYKNEFACITELVFDNMRFDAIGFNNDNRITIIEAKASISDFRRDTKWKKYLKYCNEFYFIVNKSLYFTHQNQIDIAIDGVGVIIDGSYEIIKPCTLQMIPDSQITQTVIFKIALDLTKKFAFGF